MKFKNFWLVLLTLSVCLVFNLNNGYSRDFYWSKNVVGKLTSYIKQNFDPQWSEAKTEKALPSLQVLYSMGWDTGSGAPFFVQIVVGQARLSLQIMGDTVLVGGKDITGNLGSKTTYGDHSPIIDNINNSNVIIGNDNIVNSKNQDCSNALVELERKVAEDKEMSNDDKSTVNDDIDTIQSQLKKKKSNADILKPVWIEIKKLLQRNKYAKDIVKIGKLISPLLVEI